MFVNFRKKLNSVIQDGLTLSGNLKNSHSSNLSNFSITTPTPVNSSTLLSSTNSLSSSTNQNKISIPQEINLYAGCELLDTYEHSWYEIHSLNEKNADKAIEIDQIIINLKNNSDKCLTDISDFNISLVSLPAVITSLNHCLETIQDVEKKCSEFEEKLIDLEDLLEVLELQEKQLDHRFEMAMYKEKKLVELDKVREELASQHAANVKQYELNLRKVQQERQMAFQDAFQDDLKVFKEKGSIPKVQPRVSLKEISLEEIVLDDQDTKELDDFLKE